VCVILISTGRGVFIGVQGTVTDCVISVTRQVVAGRPAMEFGLHQASAWDSPLSPLGEYLVGPTGQRVWPASHLLGPLVSGLCTLPPRVRYTTRVTLILVEF
jgi:hypothetical protein